MRPFRVLETSELEARHPMVDTDAFSGASDLTVEVQQLEHLQVMRINRVVVGQTQRANSATIINANNCA